MSGAQGDVLPPLLLAVMIFFISFVFPLHVNFELDYEFLSGFRVTFFLSCGVFVYLSAVLLAEPS